MLVDEKADKAVYDKVLEKNLARQYDFLVDCIQLGITQGPYSFDKYFLWSLNGLAISNICQFGGRFRKEPIYVGNHVPPHYAEVDEQMDRFISFVHENWNNLTPTAMAAYGLWRLNWIHPFIEGNGRTARAVSYFLLCCKYGALLPGKKIIPERIRESRAEYNAALQEADAAWADGHLNFARLEAYIASLLMEQLKEQ
jgi:fido (protein-threonine AMPylation protein)